MGKEPDGAFAVRHPRAAMRREALGYGGVSKIMLARLGFLRAVYLQRVQGFIAGPQNGDMAGLGRVRILEHG